MHTQEFQHKLFCDHFVVNNNCVLIISLFFLTAGVLADHPAAATVTTINNGNGTTTLRAQYVVPTASVADVRDDICRGAGWTATVACTQAMVTTAQCTSGQLGTQVANPESCTDAIDRRVRAFLRELRRAGEVQEAEDTFVKPVRDADHSGDLQ